MEFQHTAARRRLESCILLVCFTALFQHTAARRRLGGHFQVFSFYIRVSTHSRPKAAGNG